MESAKRRDEADDTHQTNLSCASSRHPNGKPVHEFVATEHGARRASPDGGASEMATARAEQPSAQSVRETNESRPEKVAEGDGAAGTEGAAHRRSAMQACHEPL